jgi:hypothetical protein
VKLYVFKYIYIYICILFRFAMFIIFKIFCYFCHIVLFSSELRNRSVLRFVIVLQSFYCLWGEVSMCGYLPQINRLFVVYALVVGWNTTDSELHATEAIVPLARSFVLGLVSLEPATSV